MDSEEIDEELPEAADLEVIFHFAVTSSNLVTPSCIYLWPSMAQSSTRTCGAYLFVIGCFTCRRLFYLKKLS